MIVGPTTAAEVIERYAGRSSLAAARLESWRLDPTKSVVVPRVESHTVAALYALSSDDVISVCERTEHALGDVQKGVALQVSEIRDWHPAFAFTHVLHFAVEATGKLPTFSEFRTYCREDEAGRDTLWSPAQQAVERAAKTFGRHAARDAMRWRIGNAYYSFLREMFVLAVCRESGLNARVHPLADALFRVDLWVGEVNVSLFIGNDAFRAGSAGRKDPPERLLADARPPFEFHSIQLATQYRFGVVHLPGRGDIERSAADLTGQISS